MQTFIKSLDKELANLKSLIYISSCCGKTVHNEMCLDCGEHCGEVTEKEYYE